jgi:hypothetical protein
MKYFKITNLTTQEDHFVSSTLPNESAAHVMTTVHLSPVYKYTVVEVSAKEFYGFIPRCIDFDVDEDREVSDDDEFFWD